MTSSGVIFSFSPRLTGRRFGPGALLLLSLVTAGCEQVQQTRNSVNSLRALGKAGENLEREAAKAETRQQARRVSGDTLAMPYQELQAFLPAAVGDYQPVGEPEGSMMSMTGMSYSSCARTYQMGPVDQPKTIKISLVDYNSAGAIYAGATAMLGAGFQMEDEQQRMQALDLGMPDVKALETYHKRDHRSSVVAGVGQRFFVSVEASDQTDAELAKTALKSLDLRALAAR